MYHTRAMKNLVESARAILFEQENESFTSSELRAIDDATEEMSDVLTSEKLGSMRYSHFTFRDLKRDAKGNVAKYAVRTRKGMAEFLWSKIGGKITCRLSIQSRDNSGLQSRHGAFPTLAGDNVSQVQKKFADFLKKANIGEDVVKGGLADKMTDEDLAKKHGVSVKEIQAQIAKGQKVEMEHTKDKNLATEIARDHVFEDPKYYDKLATIENE